MSSHSSGIETKICEQCSREFGCGVSAGKKCWCADHDLSEETIALLEKKYNDCLCPDCLIKMSKNG